MAALRTGRGLCLCLIHVKSIAVALPTAPGQQPCSEVCISVTPTHDLNLVACTKAPQKTSHDRCVLEPCPVYPEDSPRLRPLIAIQLTSFLAASHVFLRTFHRLQDVRQVCSWFGMQLPC